jgi:signal transduction histidine kinase
VAADFAKGELKSRAKEEGQDELADLSRTFNQMGAELEVARAKLMRWNDELRQKVDEATADLRAAQAQLLEAQKLAAIGQLGAGVAHEINNPLSGILGSAQLLMMDHPDGDPDFALLAQIEESARRCRDITQNLLKFSQMRGEVSLAKVDLNAIVKAALEFEKPRHDEAKVQVTAELSPGELWIDGDADALQQVFSQLCGNARTAMKDSADKRLTVTTRATDAGPVASVADTGKGIAQENLDRIFEPFFTTKDVWTNVGLGLSVAYRLMQEHQGRLTVESEPGKGARFTLQFQPAGTVAKIKSPAEAAPLVVGGTGTGIVR